MSERVLREALTKIVESCRFESGYTKVDTIRKLAEAALAASEPGQGEVVLVGKVRQFAEECLRRYGINPRYASEILHTPDTYKDLLKLCDVAALAQPATAEQEKEVPVNEMRRTERARNSVAPQPGAASEPVDK